MTVFFLNGCNSVSETSGEPENRPEHGYYSAKEYKEIIAHRNYVFLQADRSFQQTKKHFAFEELDSIRAVEGATWSELPRRIGEQLIEELGNFVEEQTDGPDEFVSLPTKINLHFVTVVDNEHRLALSIDIIDDQTISIDGVMASANDQQVHRLLKEIQDLADQALRNNPWDKQP